MISNKLSWNKKSSWFLKNDDKNVHEILGNVHKNPNRSVNNEQNEQLLT